MVKDDGSKPYSGSVPGRVAVFLLIHMRFKF